MKEGRKKRKEWNLKEVVKNHEKILKIYKQDLESTEENFQRISEVLTDHKERIERLFARRRYDKAQFFTSVFLIFLLLVYMANEVVKLLS